MINFLNLFKYITFCMAPVVCGNALAAESDGLPEKALFDALISNLLFLYGLLLRRLRHLQN
jgi:hypothetical protein